jgi:hypothetical protein
MSLMATPHDGTAWSAQLVADLHATSCGLCTRPATEVHCFIISSVCLHGACDQCYVRLGDRCSAGTFCETKTMTADATAAASRTDSSASAPSSALALYAFSQATPDNCCVACESAIDGDAILKETLQIITHKRTRRGYPLAVCVQEQSSDLVTPCRFGPVPLCACCLETQACTDMADILQVTPDITEMTPALRARANIIRGMQVAFMRDIAMPGTNDRVVAIMMGHTGAAGMQDAINVILGLHADSDEIILVRNTGAVRYLITATTAATEYVRAVSETASVTHKAVGAAVMRATALVWAVVSIVDSWGRVGYERALLSSSLEREGAAVLFERMLVDCADDTREIMRTLGRALDPAAGCAFTTCGGVLPAWAVVEGREAAREIDILSAANVARFLC